MFNGCLLFRCSVGHIISVLYTSICVCLVSFKLCVEWASISCCDKLMKCDLRQFCVFCVWNFCVDLLTLFSFSLIVLHTILAPKKIKIIFIWRCFYKFHDMRMNNSWWMNELKIVWFVNLILISVFSLIALCNGNTNLYL